VVGGDNTKLIAEKVTDPELLFSIIHELGQTFYRKLTKNRWEIVYFTGNKFAHFVGTLSKEKASLLESIGHKVDKIEINEEDGVIKISQE